VLQRRDVGLGVGHEAQDPAGSVADAGDVQQRAVGIMGEPAHGYVSRGTGVFQGDLAPVGQLRQDGALGEKFPLAVADGQLQAIQPLVNTHLESTALRWTQASRKLPQSLGIRAAQAGVGAAGQARQQPQVDQDLEAVADADDQAPRIDEFL